MRPGGGRRNSKWEVAGLHRGDLRSGDSPQRSTSRSSPNSNWRNILRNTAPEVLAEGCRLLHTILLREECARRSRVSSEDGGESLGQGDSINDSRLQFGSRCPRRQRRQYSSRAGLCAKMWTRLPDSVWEREWLRRLLICSVADWIRSGEKPFSIPRTVRSVTDLRINGVDSGPHNPHEVKRNGRR